MLKLHVALVLLFISPALEPMVGKNLRTHCPGTQGKCDV